MANLYTINQIVVYLQKESSIGAMVSGSLIQFILFEMLKRWFKYRILYKKLIKKYICVFLTAKSYLLKTDISYIDEFLLKFKHTSIKFEFFLRFNSVKVF